jgi:hypothetical protein
VPKDERALNVFIIQQIKRVFGVDASGLLPETGDKQWGNTPAANAKG